MNLRWKRPDWTLLLAAVLPGLIFSVYLLLHAHGVNGRNGFPLDDPWIHLTYARNLHDAHTFSYFPGDPSAQGSTSPLYTLLLALGFNFTHNEKMLSYVLDLIFQGAFLAVFAAWAARALRGRLWAVAAAVIVGLDRNISVLSVSGMETSLFLFLVALAFYARSRRSPLLAGIATGLAIWVRPDGLILALLLLGDAALERFTGGTAGSRPGAAGESSKEPPQPPSPLQSPALRALLPAAVLLAAYLVFNLAVGGGLLPNTFAAKTAYYRDSSRAFFINHAAAEVFFTGAWVVLLPFCLYAVAREAAGLFRGRSGGLRREAGWALGLPLAYFVLLPFGHRFGRYLAPALPAMAILGLRGILDLSTALEKLRRPRAARPKRPKAEAGRSLAETSWRWASPAGAAAAILLLAALALQAVADNRQSGEYTRLCAYTWTRQERTGLWLAENTPPDAVIATHDVGAIAYYSRRRIVDMVGVVLREVIPHLHQPDYNDYLAALFARKHVTHLAVLRNWCEVANVEPLFEADPQPELMDVFPWIPGRTHIMPADASALNYRAVNALRESKLSEADALINQSLVLDPLSSRSWILKGATLESGGHYAEAEACYRKCLEIFPEYPDAHLRLAAVLIPQGRKDEARRLLEDLLARKPGFAGADKLMERLNTP